MTREEGEAVVRPIDELCSQRQWSWRWRTYRKEEHWIAELKVRGSGEHGIETKEWGRVSGQDEMGALTTLVGYALEHIAAKDRIEARERAYKARMEELSPGYGADSPQGQMQRCRDLALKGIYATAQS